MEVPWRHGHTKGGPVGTCPSRARWSEPGRGRLPAREVVSDNLCKGDARDRGAQADSRHGTGFTLPGGRREKKSPADAKIHLRRALSIHGPQHEEERAMEIKLSNWAQAVLVAALAAS